jgi:threonine aldolase
MVIFDIGKTGLPTADALALLRSKRVLLTDSSYTSLRAVTHMDVTMEQVKAAARILANTFKD